MVQCRNKTVVGYVFEVAEANCSLFFVEIPEIDLVSFERGFRPGIPQTEMMVMSAGEQLVITSPPNVFKGWMKPLRL